MNYRPEIDGLRAIAIVSVLGYHFFPVGAPNGGLGVDVFFVISGFVITASLYYRRDRSLSNFLIEFFKRRVKRLMPALLVMIAVTGVAISLMDPVPEQSINTGIAAALGLSNNYLYIIAQDYFGPTSALNPFTHTWSLGAEEQFYLLFPFLFWIGWKLGGWLGASLLLISLALSSFAGWLLIQGDNPLAAFYIVVFRFWQIAFGALVFLAQLRFAPGRLNAATFALKTVSVLALVALLFMPLEIDRQIAAMVCIIATGAALYGIGESTRAFRVLQTGVTPYLGKISYSLYLWHWPVMVFLAWIIGKGPATAVAGIVVSILLAHVSWAYLERPLRDASWSAVSRRELGAGLLAMVTTAGLLHMYNTTGRQLLLGEQVTSDAELGRSSLFLPHVSENGTVWAGRDCTLVNNQDIGKIIEVERCTVSEPLETAQSRVLIIGNSFAPAFAAAYDISSIHDGAKTSFILTAKFGGSPVPDIDWRSHSREATADYWARVVPVLLAQLQPGDQVLLISDLAKLSPEQDNEWATKAREDLRKGLIEFSDQLALQDIGLSVLGPLPFIREADCTPQMALRQWRSAGLSLCRYYSRDETVERFAPVTNLLGSLVTAGKIDVLDLFEVFCPDEVCEYTDNDGILLYRDVYSHASLKAAYRSRALVAKWLKQVQATSRGIE
ncbi:putative acyltransferase (plasmid) [Hoeflea sp. IMCC20628]|uniref:acyltransferase family protein n=1 Tax=Hoeflea sp. IMCC20628 TaxID=1620421 RepID=UPI00063A91F4|nr:acyltransferase family protein [Hoeflea sp. IMCC20628]AKI03379.1 putative acyltransferase [Hoeflea sp. IMCC20628]